MWTAACILAILASLALVLGRLRALGDDRLTRLVILLIWGRFALTALGEVATRPLAAGQSLLAIGTLGGIAAALLVLPLDRLRLGAATPFLALAGLALLSGLLNAGIAGTIDALTLWILFLVVALLVHRGLRLHGLEPVLGALLAVFTLPLGVQALSVVFARPTVGQDGSVGYIGTFVHEAVFAIVALAALWLATLYPWRRRAWLLGAFCLAGTAMMLANYRTLILACLPLVVALIVRLAGARAAARPPVGPILVGLLAVGALVPLLPTERFAELGDALAGIGDLTKPPQEFTAADKDLLSARAFIAATYVDQFVGADLLRLLIGFGPGAQARAMDVHPHNEYIRILFQTGIVGFLLWLGTLLGHLALALRSTPRPAGMVLAAGYVALLLGSLGTSFFNRPEGMIFFALLCATTWHLSERRRVPEPRAGRRDAGEWQWS